MDESEQEEKESVAHVLFDVFRELCSLCQISLVRDF